MIPTVDDVIDEYEAWSGDRGLREKRALLTELLHEAWGLAPEPADEPAVLFFVFCRHWWKLAEHCTTFIDWLAVSQLERVGLPVKLDPRELMELRLDVCADFGDLDEVREWFSEQYAKQLD